MVKHFSQNITLLKIILNSKLQTVAKRTVYFTAKATTVKLPTKWRKINDTKTKGRILQYIKTIPIKQITVLNPYCDSQEKTVNDYGSFENLSYFFTVQSSLY